MSSPGIPNEINRPVTPPAGPATQDSVPKTPPNNPSPNDADSLKTGTPKSDKVSTRAIGHKDTQYNPMVVSEMSKRWHQMSDVDFMRLFVQVSGRTTQTIDLSLEQQEAVGSPLADLSDVWMTQNGRVEPDMYPVLVSAPCILPLEG